MVEPTTDSWRKNTRFRSAGGFAPLVAPDTTIRPPGRNARSECSQVAAPTVSITASTFSGRRVPGSAARSAPAAVARSRLSASREVQNTVWPSAFANTIAADATPPPAPWTSTVEGPSRPERVVSIR